MPYKDKTIQKEKNREYQKKHYQSNKEYYIEKASKSKLRIRTLINNLKSKLGCSRCLENDPVCLDFHHRDSKQKKFNIGKALVDGLSEEKIMNEIKKCDVLCSNCHRKLHFKIAG